VIRNAIRADLIVLGARNPIRCARDAASSRKQSGQAALAHIFGYDMLNFDNALERHLR
jgi:hypothetical protein